MVRLKQNIVGLRIKPLSILNSTMVRLKLIRIDNENKYAQNVSIPLWFD